ncbi:hypothetical protein H0E87_028895 [Populus deltoides]|uniref:Myb-like domain-containing protein n=1 Tax=Populus deltoides TaxID=3696 RepID=A0A8T2WXV6_POPDE|nr:hypothetical protein H0E87_028895 [Populus deltoides]
MANPSGTHNQEGNQGPSSFNGSNPNNGNLGQDPSSGSSLKHNPGISNDWTGEEQAILEEGLAKYAMETNVVRYAKIALQLPNKTVRDVALRCRWMTKKENSKRRKEDNLLRKSKDKKERHNDPSAKTSNFMATRPNVTPFATPMMPLDSDEGISYDGESYYLPLAVIGGVTGELLNQNAQTLHQISANLASYQIQENLSLLRQTRDNICKVMNEKDIEGGGGHVWRKTSCCLPKFGPNLLVSNQASVQSSIKATETLITDWIKGVRLESKTDLVLGRRINFSGICSAAHAPLSLQLMDDVPELMKQMPPLPVKLNDDLADTILLPPNLPRQ